MDKAIYGQSRNLAAAVGVGALLAVVLGSKKGRHCVATTWDRTARLVNSACDFVDVGVRDLGNRASGVAAQAGGLMRREEAGNAVLAGRVRTQLGRLVSHPHAIHVVADAGRITLSGPVLKDEERQLLSGVRKVRGVKHVENRLDVHESGSKVSALQGGRGRVRPRRPEFMQASWAPGPRLLAIAGGTALVGYCLTRRDFPGRLMGLAGLGLITRAAANTDLGRLAGLVGEGLDIRKTITIAAPRERVFDVWSNYENFPRFMSFVEKVQRIDDVRSHWKVKGPAGMRFEWDSAVTEFSRPESLAWRSEPGAVVQHTGTVRFEEAGDGTRVSVCMTYTPPGGALADSVVALLGQHPERELDADLMRMKVFIEAGGAADIAA